MFVFLCLTDFTKHKGPSMLLHDVGHCSTSCRSVHFFLHSPVGGNFSCFHVLTIVNDATWTCGEDTFLR